MYTLIHIFKVNTVCCYRYSTSWGLHTSGFLYSILVCAYWWFRTVYQSIFLGFLTLECGTNRLSWNTGKQLQTYVA